MTYTLVKGTFIPKPTNRHRPDGDSIRFGPDDLSPLRSLPRWGRAPKFDVRKTINLRYEGIDAPELRQNATKPFAQKALDRNIELLGLSDIKGKKPGYILTRQLGIYGRPISFVFAGETTEEDGTCVELNVDKLKESVNFKLLQEGFVYPLFYHTLATDLRLALVEAAKTARDCKKGIWRDDRTHVGVKWAGKEKSLLALDPIFPKLWRRLNKYAKKDLSDFSEFVKEQQDVVCIFEEQRFADFSEIICVDGCTVKMCICPEKLIFVSGKPNN